MPDGQTSVTSGSESARLSFGVTVAVAVESAAVSADKLVLEQRERYIYQMSRQKESTREVPAQKTIGSEKMEKWPKVVAEIVGMEGNAKCTFGHKVGERFEFSEFSTARMCTYAYSALRPAIDILLHGGQFPWTKKNEVVYWGCPHPGKGQVISKLKVCKAKK